MTSPTRPEVSPLGDHAAVSTVKQRYPTLAEHIDDVEAIVTPEFDRADRAAIDTQARIKQNRLIEMGGGLLVVVFALIRLGVGDRAQWAAAVAAIIAAGTGVVSVAGRRHGLEQWLDNRRIAEELRSLYFRWLVSGAELPVQERRRKLRSEVTRIIAVESVRIGPELTGDETASGDEDIPLHDDVWHLYREARLHDQLDWLRNRASRVSSRSRSLQNTQVLLMTAAAVCGLLSGYIDGDDGRLLAVPVAATAAIVGFLATVDALTASDRLAQHYERTVRRLDVIDRSLANSPATLADVELVEAVLLSEHRTWHRITEGNQQ